MSHRQGTLVGLLALILFLRLMKGNKLGRAWTVLWSKSFKDAAAAPQASGTGSAGGGGAVQGQPVPVTSVGGLPSAQAFLHKTTPVIDMTAAHISPIQGGEYHEWNFDTPSGTPAYLPAGSWQVDAPTWGGGKVAEFTPVGTSGFMEYLHLSANFVGNLIGKVLPGGTEVGLTGDPAVNRQPGELGAGPHLAVVVNKAASQYLGVA